jgi:Domain of unknown function (DUF4388)
VSLAGRLEEIELAELLHFLALNNRTGKVTLSRREAHGIVVVRLGRIVYAASSSIRETFGNILICQGLVTPEVLAAALERQHLAADGRRLGALLVESAAITEAQLQDALKQQTGLVVQELCRWRSGYFRFEVTPVASSGDIGVDAEELVVKGGVATDQVLLEAMTAMDEAAPAGEPPATPLAIAHAPLAPALRGEVTLGLLRRAAPLVGRGLLLVLRGDEAHGAGQVGLGGDDPDELARRVRLPLGEPSIVAQAVERRESWKGKLPAGAANDGLLDMLGGPRPGEALVVPMILREGAGLVLYGDDVGAPGRLGATDELEWALLEAGLAMERDLLDQRLSDFERARGFRP